MTPDMISRKRNGNACPPAHPVCGVAIGEADAVLFPTLANIPLLYRLDPDLSIHNIRLASFRFAEMRLERPQRGNQYTGGGLLAHAPPVPALLKRPFLQRLLPPHYVPYT